jgi:hypothetical protein
MSWLTVPRYRRRRLGFWRVLGAFLAAWVVLSLVLWAWWVTVPLAVAALALAAADHHRPPGEQVTKAEMRRRLLNARAVVDQGLEDLEGME